MAPWLIAAIPAAVNLISQALSNRAAKKNVERTNDANLQLAKYQYDINSPANQIKQYAAAGLNPNLIYGSGTGAASRYEAPTLDYRRPVHYDLLSQISSFQDTLLKQEQIKNVSAQTQSLQARTINEGLKSAGIAASSKIKEGTASSVILKSQWDAIAQEWAAKFRQNEVNMQPTKMLNLHRQGEVMESTLTGQQLDNFYKQNRNQWAAMGIREGDHVAIRMVIRIMQSMGIPVSDFFK